MKSLNKYISQVKTLHSLNEFIAESKTLHQNVNIAESKTLHQNVNIQEKLIVNKNYKSFYEFTPKSWNELREIIEDRYNKLGSGTANNPIDFNDIDISNIDSFHDEDMRIFEKNKF